MIGTTRPLDGHMRVVRVLPQAPRRALGPFVFLDHFGPVDLPAGAGFDVRPHPHIGLATVTAMFAGEIHHRDSLGVSQVIRPDELNLMIAGRGIVHSERATETLRTRGGPLHGLQLWMALPAPDESCEPSFAHHAADALPSWADGGARVHLLLGEFDGRRAPASPPGQPLLVDVRLDDGATWTAAPAAEEYGVYVAEGSIACAGERHDAGHLLIGEAGAGLELLAIGAARVALLGGAALDGPRHLEWNFVATTRERLAQARDDWRARRFPVVPGDELEFIPYG